MLKKVPRVGQLLLMVLAVTLLLVTSADCSPTGITPSQTPPPTPKTHLIEEIIPSSLVMVRALKCSFSASDHTTNCIEAMNAGLKEIGEMYHLTDSPIAINAYRETGSLTNALLVRVEPKTKSGR